MPQGVKIDANTEDSVTVTFKQNQGRLDIELSDDSLKEPFPDGSTTTAVKYLAVLASRAAMEFLDDTEGATPIMHADN